MSTRTKKKSETITKATNQVEALLKEAMALYRNEKVDEAVTTLREAIRLEPGAAVAHNNLGVALRALGRVPEAIDSYRCALARNNNNADTHYNLGNALRETGNLEEATESYLQALEYRPDYVAAESNLGLTLMDLGRFEEAVESFERARCLDPGEVEINLNLGIGLLEQNKLAAAESIFRLSTAEWPEDVRVIHNLAVVLNRQNQSDEALRTSERAVETDPAFVPALALLGQILVDMGRCEEALEYFDRTISIDGENLGAHLGKARSFLLMGKLSDGWEEAEWRWRREENPPRKFSEPEWDGSALKGRTLLLYAEQGLGDTIQFARYASCVEKSGGRIILECQKTLMGLFVDMPSIDAVISVGQPMPDFDVQAALMSVPRLLGTTLDTIPAEVGYVKRRKVSEGVVLNQSPDGAVNVGIVWAGSPTHDNDVNRSCSIAHFIKLMGIPGLAFYSLQKGAAESDIGKYGCQSMVQDIGKRLMDFSDTADVVDVLDLVITVDTAVAHLAGAMGKRVWVLLPFSPDWRWMLGREDSPWYPRMRLYRQEAPGDWPEVFACVAADLERLAGGDRSVLDPRRQKRRPGRAKRTARKTPGKKPQRDQRPRAARDRPPLDEFDHDRRGQLRSPEGTEARALTAEKQSRYGTMRYLPHDMFVGRSFDLYGEYCEQETELFRQIVGPGSVVIEAGANIGAHTIFLAKHVGPKGKIIAHEPQRFIYELLCHNVARNEIENVDARQRALGAARGTIRVPPCDYERAGNFGGVSLGGEEGDIVPVETIDDLRLERLDLIKADVEGMEKEVLEGAVDTIRRLRPLLYVENDRNDRSNALISFIQQLDYRLWWHLPRLYNPNNYCGESRNVFDNIVSINLFCVPTKTKTKISGLQPVVGPDDDWRDVTQRLSAVGQQAKAVEANVVKL